MVRKLRGGTMGVAACHGGGNASIDPELFLSPPLSLSVVYYSEHDLDSHISLQINSAIEKSKIRGLNIILSIITGN